MKRNKPFIALVVALSSFLSVKAATYTWTGGTSTSWGTNSNWSGNSAPSASSTHDIIINSGASFYPVLTTNTSCRSLRINGGNFSTSNRTFTVSAFISVYGGTFTAGSNSIGAADILVDGGTFTGSAGNISCSNSLTLTSGTFTGPSGTLTVTNDITIEGGTFSAGTGAISISASGATFDMSGGTYTGASGSLTLANDGVFNLSAGTFSAGTGNITLNGNNGNVNISGGTFTGSTGVFNADYFNITGGNMSINGNRITVDNDFNLDGGSITVNTADFEVANDLFLISGSMDLNNFDINVADVTTIEGTVTVTDPGRINTRDLDIDLTSSTATLNVPVRISNSNTLTNGILITSSNNLLIFAADATTSSASATKHINGPVRKEIKSGGSMNSFTFPIGNGAVAAPLRLESFQNRSNNDYFTATYYNNRNSNASGSKANTIDHISQAEYWDLSRGSSGTAQTTARVNLSFDETKRSGVVDNRSQLVIAHWTGTQWEDLGNSATSGNNDVGTVTSNLRATSYSPFTLASTTSLNPLPVHLINFNAFKENNLVSVSWSTSSEINSDKFEVLKSLDGLNWVSIGTVKAAGNSNTVSNYTFIDVNPVKGIQYYKLKETDLNGDFSMSPIAVVNFNAPANIGKVSVYPVPVSNVLNLNVQNPENNTVKIVITNSLGVVVCEMNADNNQVQIDMTRFSSGIYTVQTLLEGNVVSVNKVLKY